MNTLGTSQLTRRHASLMSYGNGVMFLSQNLYVLRTVTHGALAGLISQREFIDLIIIEKNDEFLATLGRFSQIFVDFDYVS